MAIKKTQNTTPKTRAANTLRTLNHARKDYRNIVKCTTEKFDPNEPVFLLRAKDALFINVLQHYVNLARFAGVNELVILSIEHHMIAARVWQSENKVKLPDMDITTFKY